MLLSVIGVLFCCFAGAAKSVQDTLAHHFGSSIFSNVDKYSPRFWNPKKSWMNKYKFNPETGVLDMMPKFWGSTTVFVAFTDGWHLSQLFHINCLSIGMFLIGVNVDIYAFVIGAFLYRAVFEGLYRWGLGK